MKTICFYHSADLDGHCSGAIVKKFVPEAELIGINYGQEVPWEKVAGAIVYMVDFSLQPWTLMQTLAGACAELIWIDHHKTAIDEMQAQGWAVPDPSIKIKTYLAEGTAACELCWEFFFSPYRWMPVAVKWLGRYDVWDLDYSEEVLPFQMGMRSLNLHNPEVSAWRAVFESDDDWIDHVIDTGRTIIDWQDKQNERLMHSAFVTVFEGKKFLCVNAGGINSMAFKSKYDPAIHDAAMAFSYKGKERIWTISMYSPDQRTDCSEIAKQHGGGGHKFACGFQSVNIDFLTE